MITLTRLSTLCFIAAFGMPTVNFSTSSICSPGSLLFADTLRNQAMADTAVKHYLALGDSYTIGQSVKINERYPMQIAEKLRNEGYNIADPEIIATTGWTTGNLLKAVRDKPALPGYDVVSLLIGVNNQYQRRPMDEYRIEFTALLKKAIRFAGNRPQRVVVFSIPDYSVTPFAHNSDREKIAREINSFNLVNKRVSDACHVKYVNITDETRKAAWDHSLIAYDDLHFSGKEYSIWTSLVVPMMSESLRK
jgi:lysophospholipase L1-like esterase